MGDRRGHVATSSEDLLKTLARGIAALEPARVVRVAIDGVDAAGKTTLAGDLVVWLRALGGTVTRVGADDYLRPAAERYRLGRYSPEGYYADSFDHDRLRSAIESARDAIVLVDGIFLLRPELRDLWHFAVFLVASRDVIVGRAATRDLATLGDAAEIERLYATRYLPAQIAYMQRERPHDRANVVVDNSDAECPRVLPVGAAGEALELLEGVLRLDATDRP